MSGVLHDKVVIVTGVGPGMGSKIAIEAANAGAHIAIAARTEDFLHEVASQITENGRSVESIPTDVSSESDCENLATKTVSRFGRIDGLVNCAYRPGELCPIEQLDYDDLRQSLEVTLFGTLMVSRAVLPYMKSQGHGSIVNISSQVARKHLPGQGGYALTKAAVSCLSRQMALEFGPFGIRVNTTHHGWMWGKPVEQYMLATSEASGTSVEEMKAAVAAGIPLGELPEDSTCARAVIMLLSDYADAVTGAGLDVNGGEYMPL